MNAEHLPHSQEAEASVLSAMMLGDRASAERGLDILTAHDFHLDLHAQIFEAIGRLVRAGRPVDIVTLIEAMRGSLEVGTESVVRGYVAQIVDRLPSAANLEWYAETVRDHAVRRRLVEAARTMTRAAGDADTPIAEVVAQAEQALFAATGSERAQARPQLVRDLLPAHYELIEERMRSGGALVGLESGHEDWDRRLGGLRRGNLVTIAARPAMGKTAHALCTALNVAKAGGVALFFSLEMTRDELLDRMIAVENSRSADSVQRGALTDGEYASIVRRTTDAWYDAALVIDDESDLSPGQMLSRARRVRAERGLDLVVVDYLQRAAPDTTRRGGTEAEEIGGIAKSLKTMAKVLDVPVLAVAQVSRAVEKREDKRPVMSDLGESGKIERESDSVTFLYRPAYYAPPGAERVYGEPEEIELVIAKNRHGATGIVKQLFWPDFTRFDNLTHREDWA